MWSWIMLRPISRKLVVVPQIMQVMIILMGSKHGVAWKCLQAWWCSKHDDNLKYGSLVAAANRHSNGRVKSTQSGAYSSKVRNGTFKICSWCWDQISERICSEHGVAWKCLRACRTRDIWTQSKTSWTTDGTRENAGWYWRVEGKLDRKRNWIIGYFRGNGGWTNSGLGFWWIALGTLQKVISSTDLKTTWVCSTSVSDSAAP